jgi:hypothetical protein
MRQHAAWLVGARPYALLAALCLLLYVPGIGSIPPLDRDEARFAQASRQMLETGDFLRIRFQDEARNKKPAGIYWLQAAAVAAFSTPASAAIWPYRLPSLLGAMAAVLLTFALGTALLAVEEDGGAARRIAFFAALLLGTALGTVIEAHVAKTDAALLAAATAGERSASSMCAGEPAGRPYRLSPPCSGLPKSRRSCSRARPDQPWRLLRSPHCRLPTAICAGYAACTRFPG